jgi:Concanavalin A-like lectin/glucanases superfamily
MVTEHAAVFDGLDDYVEVADHPDYSIATTGELTPGQWLLVAGAWDATRVHIYRDGVLRDSDLLDQSATGGVTITPEHGDAPVRIGTRQRDQRHRRPGRLLAAGRVVRSPRTCSSGREPQAGTGFRIEGKHRLQLGHLRLDVVSQPDGRMGCRLLFRAGHDVALGVHEGQENRAAVVELTVSFQHRGVVVLV